MNYSGIDYMEIFKAVNIKSLLKYIRLKSDFDETSFPYYYILNILLIVYLQVIMSFLFYNFNTNIAILTTRYLLKMFCFFLALETYVTCVEYIRLDKVVSSIYKFHFVSILWITFVLNTNSFIIVCFV